MIHKEKKPEVWKIRPHHGLCLQFFEGKGYSEGFTAHMGQVKKALERDGQILITESADEICQCCPNLREGVCVSDEKVRLYDRRVLEKCGLNQGETLSWKEFSGLVRGKIIAQAERKNVCPDCQWRELCEEKEQR